NSNLSGQIAIPQNKHLRIRLDSVASAEIQYHEVVGLIDCKDRPAQTCSVGDSLADSFPAFLSFLRLIGAILDGLLFFGKKRRFFFRAVQLAAKIIDVRLQIS